MTWQKSKTRRPVLTSLQRLQLLVLRLERLAIIEQVQRTQAVIRGLVPTEKKS
jgi:hypothetical protein